MLPKFEWSKDLKNWENLPPVLSFSPHLKEMLVRAQLERVKRSSIKIDGRGAFVMLDVFPIKITPKAIYT